MNADPNKGNPPAVKEPGGYGPYDESESHLFYGPVDKGIQTAIGEQLGLDDAGFRGMQAWEGAPDALGQVWDNLVKGAKQTFQAVRANLGPATPPFQAGHASLQRLGGHLNDAIAVPATGAELLGQGVDSIATALEQGYKEYLTAGAGYAALKLRRHSPGGPLPNQDQLEALSRQQLGHAVGTMLFALGSLGAGMEGENVAEDQAPGAARGLGRTLEERAAGPMNAMVRAREQNFLHGANPGRVGFDEPYKPSLTLEGVRRQTAGFQDRLAGQVNDLLKRADTVQAIQKDGSIRTASNILDTPRAINEAFQETMDKLDESRAVGTEVKGKMRAALDDLLKDTILQDEAHTPSEANRLKQNIGRQIKWYDPKNLPEDDVNVRLIKDDFRKNAYRNLNDLVDNSVGGAPGSTIKELNRRYGNLAEFEKLLDKRIDLEKGTGGWAQAVRKMGWSGAFWALIHGDPLTGLGLGGNQALRTTPGRIVTARVLGGAARVLQSPEGAGAVATGARVAGAAPMVTGAMGQRVLAGGDQEGEGQ